MSDYPNLRAFIKNASGQPAQECGQFSIFKAMEIFSHLSTKVIK